MSLTTPPPPPPPPNLVGFVFVQSLALCVVFWESLFPFFLLVIILPVLFQFTVSIYPFGIFKIFLGLSSKHKIYAFHLLLFEYTDLNMCRYLNIWTLLARCCSGMLG